MNGSNYIVISLGGSLIVPNEIDINFLKEFTNTIKHYVNNGFKFVIITGGGKVCRRYNDALSNIVSPSNEDLDWMGIAVTRLNAEFVRISFGDLAYEKVILNPDEIPQTNKPILLSAGWKPGNSSDLAAIHCAQSVGAKVVVNLSNIDYAYDKDPNKYPDAKKIEKSSWADFRALLPKEWEPGLSAPFDPIAAQKAEELGIEVAIMNGKNIENFKSYFDGGEFVGTVIRLYL